MSKFSEREKKNWGREIFFSRPQNIILQERVSLVGLVGLVVV